MKKINALWAMSLGWKIRKILKLPIITELRRKIKDMEELSTKLNEIEPQEPTVKMQYKNKYMKEDLLKSKKSMKMEMNKLICDFLEKKDWPSQIHLKLSTKHHVLLHLVFIIIKFIFNFITFFF